MTKSAIEKAVDTAIFKAKELGINLGEEYLLLPFNDGYLSIGKHDDEKTIHIDFEFVDNVCCDFKDKSLNDFSGGIIEKEGEEK